MKRYLQLAFILSVFLLLMNQEGDGCHESANRLDSRQQQAAMLEGRQRVGYPAVTNFREKQMLKTIYEMRDRADLVTYVYLQNHYTGKPVYLGRAIGYPMPYSTMYTSSTNYDSGKPQAEPNGLWPPTDTHADWLMMIDPRNGQAKIVFLEPDMIVSPFPLGE